MKYLAALAGLLCATAPAAAKDFGQQGTVFPIVEPDLLEQIRAKLQRLEASGETARLNADLKKRTIARVNRPEPVAGLGVASSPRQWTFDPTITVEADISDDKGRLIISAGTRVNPLDTVGLRQKLIFIDGDDAQQVAWAIKNYRQADAKLILVRGAPLDLMRARQRRFYFDQGGTLVKRFGIRAVPAIVEQQGRILLVREVPLRKPQGTQS
ncbi:type-F conjugative transfer system protein TraW [Sphingorhabdus sp.]|uniref:type-F conjugative transfer system protein TraW n=1 Tax=Sphingorhabdus sp. TaxID=1902408 RepID=UPI0035AEC62C